MDPFALPDWYMALGLEERIPGLPLAAGGSSDAGNPERAARRLARWQAQPPFSQDGLFDRRLARDGIDRGALLALLGESPAALAARYGEPPTWVEELRRSFLTAAPERFPLSSDRPASASASASAAGARGGGHSIPFLEIVRPLLDAGYSHLSAGLRLLTEASPQAPFSAVDAAALAAPNLEPHLLFLVGRALALELYLAGEAGQLSGGTPEERFASFAARLRQPEIAVGLLRQYPVMARQGIATIDRWADYSLEIFTHLAADAARLQAVFSPGRSLGRIVELNTGLGDPHRGGRSVAGVRFDSGVELVYKPRSMAGDAAFQALLEWTAARGFAPAFRRPRLVEGSGYGWAERIVAAPCASAAEVERFYLRQGGFLALLYLLSGTDMHNENVIAAGEHPVPVDLEALFHPTDRDLGRDRHGLAFPDTVLSVGFLPSLQWGVDGANGGVDLSGLAAGDGQLAPRPMLRIEGAGTDQMRFERRPTVVNVGDHRPTLEGAPVHLPDHTDEIVEGFTRMARLMAAHRDELLSKTGPLAAFASVSVRVVLRPSMAYASLLGEGQHPYVLSDALERDRLLDRIWMAVPDDARLERILGAERRELSRGDIPLFTTRPSSRDLWASDGERCPDFLGASGLERVRGRIHAFDEAEIARQTWIVRASLDVLTAREHSQDPDCELREATIAPSSGELLAMAVEAGRRLAALALRRDDAAFWLVPVVMGRNQRFLLTPAGLDLHLGLPGIALFLAYLGAVSGEAEFTALARAATVTMRDQIAHGASRVDSIGAFSGWGSVIYGLTHLGVLWQDEALLAEAERVAAGLAPQIAADLNLDVVSGAAGCLVSLLGLHAVRPDRRWLDLARQCGDRILGQARAMGQGIGWLHPLAGPTPLAGFSHGAAGISWALFHLAAAGGEDRFRQGACQALAYERSLYRPDLANWPDLRSPSAPEPTAETEPHFMCAWCHGAAGIALGRLDSLRFHDDDALRQEIEAGIATTLATGFGGGQCLCHGDLGNLEAVVLAADTLGRRDLAERAGRLAGGVLANLRQHGWRLGIGKAEAPGLMVGIAGVGYGLLRLAAPRQIPAVLRLAPPPAFDRTRPMRDDLAPALVKERS